MIKRLADSEWIILRALWGKQPQSMKQIVASIQKEQSEVAWGYKTYHTYLRNMCEKGLIGSSTRNQKDKLYYAIVSEEEALRSETDSILSRRGYFGSVGRLMVSMAEHNQLSAQDRRELLDLAQRLERQAEGEGE